MSIKTLWELAPIQANYIVKNDDGYWYWFVNEPVIKKPSFFNIFGRTRIMPEYEVLWRHRIQHQQTYYMDFQSKIFPCFIPIKRPIEYKNIKTFIKKKYKV